ncbi:MAG: 16S rRNA (uracil(1498)-N(3))-methyltransferase [Alteromonadaceae bacterium]|nr:16S rRNA (uracil(1498)-N(3))-methyltransferase [Alteromonadaceae bacterium]
MRISRFFVPDTLSVDSTCQLPAETAHYIHNVLRLREGEPVVLFNGDGNEYAGELVVVQKRSAEVLVNAKLALSCESPLSLHLGQGIAKGDRMDFVLQKATELGVTDITPIITERCNVKLNTERWEKKSQQWLKIIASACEQSGRNQLPTLHPPITLAQWLKQPTQQVRLLLHPDAEQALPALPIRSQGARILIGPEGGLSDAEIYQAGEAGFTHIKMGPRVLRTETAALTVLSVLQAQFGDLL